MQSSVSKRFPHRLNRNGSYDSICTTCLATVSTQLREADLVAAEEEHVCDSLSMAARQGATRFSEGPVEEWTGGRPCRSVKDR
jgi:hypothetical protein